MMLNYKNNNSRLSSVLFTDSLGFNCYLFIFFLFFTYTSVNCNRHVILVEWFLRVDLNFLTVLFILKYSN